MARDDSQGGERAKNEFAWRTLTEFGPSQEYNGGEGDGDCVLVFERKLVEGIKTKGW